jgi:hypothetical protein
MKTYGQTVGHAVLYICSFNKPYVYIYIYIYVYKLTVSGHFVPKICPHFSVTLSIYTYTWAEDA